MVLEHLEGALSDGMLKISNLEQAIISLFRKKYSPWYFVKKTDPTESVDFKTPSQRAHCEQKKTTLLDQQN